MLLITQKPCSCMLLVITVMSAVELRAQSPDTPIVTVGGEVLKSLNLSLNDLVEMKSVEVSAKDHSGELRTFKGVALNDILASAGVPLGSSLRGKNLFKYVIVTAADSYEVIFSLPEIDPEFTSQTILLAYQVDGDELAKGDGPLRMVVPNDKKHARWVREVVSIRIAVGKE